MQKVNLALEKNLADQLKTFIANNPTAKIEGDNGRSLITHPWDDDTLALEINVENNALIETLNNVIFPPLLTAIYHADIKKLEFIYRVELEDAPLWSRSFEFYFDGIKFNCSYGPSTERLMQIAKHAQWQQPASSTDYRNLRMYKDFAEPSKISPAAVRYFEKRKPLSFFIEPISIENSDLILEIAKHLNFYMFYYDRDTPEIDIHRRQDIAAIFQETPKEIAFPSSIIGSKIDSYLLDLWNGAHRANGRLEFLYFYQMLEYAAFYYVEEQVKSRVSKILRRPEILSSIETCLPLVFDEIVDYKQSSDHKLAQVIQKSVDPEKIWTVIKNYSGYFSSPQTFDGGFVVDAIIKENWSASDFATVLTPKIPDTLRKIRNALVHSRESRVGQVIAPSRANSAKLMPWVKVIEEIGCQIAIFRNL